MKSLNLMQKRILIVGIGIIVLMGLFPSCTPTPEKPIFRLDGEAPVAPPVDTTPIIILLILAVVCLIFYFKPHLFATTLAKLQKGTAGLSQMKQSSTAEYWKRLCALTIDVVILLLAFTILDHLTKTNNAIYYLIIFWLYFALCESSKLQATVGKKLLNISVADLSLKRISFLKASVRFCFKILPILLFVIIKSGFKGQLGLIGGFVLWFLFLSCYPFFDKKRTFLHDRIAGTIVINKPVETDKEIEIADTEGVSEQERSEPIEKQEGEVSAIPVERKKDRTMRNLNLMQKRIMLVGVAVIVLMGLFPPWIETTTTTTKDILHGTFHTNSVETVAGYYFLSNAPRGGKDIWDAITTYHLDFGRLLIQWFFVSLSTAALMFYFKE